MELNEYQKLSKRTMPATTADGYTDMDKANYAMGLSGEAGEVTDTIKKFLCHGHPVDKKKIIEELGDVLHYLSGLATMYDLTLDEVAAGNIEKLMKRYPNGFNTEDSIKRVDAK